jgi:PAS domain S-box-containing protein
MEVHIWEVVRDAVGAIVTWRLVDANRVALTSWGKELDEVVGLTTEEIFPGSDAVQTFLPVVSEIIATGVPKEWETNFSGTGQILHMVSIPVGEYFVSTGFDVTEDRMHERELHAALLSLNQATQAGGVGLWDWDLRTDVVRYSDEYKRQLGYEPDEMGDDLEEWRSRVHPDDLDTTVQQVQAKMDDPQRKVDVTFRLRHKDGSYRWILAQSSTVLGDDGKPERMLGSHIDITERLQLEARVREAEKLEAIGTLAAGIAHDFNNLLGAITGNLSILRETAADDPDVPVLYKELDDATKRAAGLTSQLLTFAKGGTPVRDATAIRDLIVEWAQFVTRGSNCRCEFRVADDLDTVEVDIGQLNQVMNNLLINAMQAMPEGGTIEVGAQNALVDGGGSQGLPAGRYVHIWVTDHGVGIPSELLPRIFDPFFTTKASGSGLGLATSRSIITKHGGSLTARSTVGEGTEFDVYVPSSAAAPQGEAEQQVVAGNGHILVMDDDAAMRSVFQRMLERLGFTCDVCSDGGEALHRYEEAMRNGMRYDAVILDLTIAGGQGGAQVLERLKAIDPAVVGVVTSGYTEDDVLARYEHHGFRGRLQKPVRMAALSAEMARVMAGPTR